MDVREGEEDFVNSQTQERTNALKFLKILIVMEGFLKVLKILISCAVLFLTRNEKCEVPLKLFLLVYMVITIAKFGIFMSKNLPFFRINRIPEYRENTDITLFSNFIEALLLFWYLIGFNWIQECENCSVANPLLYYTTVVFVGLGFVAFIAPLIAIVLLLFLITFVKPKLQEVMYKDQSDVSDDTYHCAICFDNYIPGIKLKLLPCGHHFHQECIDEWLDLKDTCPLCKRNINLLYDLIDPPEYDV
ncbi:E3 ubiquitin-protein ligase [Encephalitozoon hellem]|uniref:RING-type E3 ubiquitin transferase n=1 Tax=Encephalitozoon hellem TaxID=27973 RepID=A0ABY8CHN9_ENCHE|nr:E3 ubiquitin-protein ligase [Encephalitozoon hellem]WEL38402.1 RING-finger domain-containing protein [Encephalitozoon hellem]